MIRGKGFAELSIKDMEQVSGGGTISWRVPNQTGRITRITRSPGRNVISWQVPQSSPGIIRIVRR